MAETTQPVTRLDWLERVKAVGILQVVLNHAAAPGLLQNDPGSVKWYSATLVLAFTPTAITLFLLVSGALLLHKDEPVPVFGRKRFSRIAIPFGFWSLGYYLLAGFAYGAPMTPLGFVTGFMEHKLSFHLWFLYLLIPLYLVIPILRKAVAFVPTWMLVGYAVLAGSTFLVTDFFSVFGVNIWWQQTPFSSGVAYLLLGYVLVHRDFSLPKPGWIVAGGYLFFVLGKYGMYWWTGQSVGIFTNAFSVTNMVVAVALFQLFRDYRPTKLSSPTRSLARHSFGIYLAHMAFIGPLQHFGPISYTASLKMMLATIAGLVVISLLGSWALSAGLQRIPGLRRLV